MSEYPTDKDLKKLKELGNKVGAVQETVELLKEIWWYPEYVKFNATDKHNWSLELVTCGWSGNETIIDTLSETMFWMMYWQESKRGGYFLLKKETS